MFAFFHHIDLLLYQGEVISWKTGRSQGYIRNCWTLREVWRDAQDFGKTCQELWSTAKPFPARQPITLSWIPCSGLFFEAQIFLEDQESRAGPGGLRVIHEFRGIQGETGGNSNFPVPSWFPSSCSQHKAANRSEDCWQQIPEAGYKEYFIPKGAWMELHTHSADSELRRRGLGDSEHWHILSIFFWGGGRKKGSTEKSVMSRAPFCHFKVKG